MSAEKRDNRNLNLNSRTQIIPRDDKIEHIWHKSGQLDLCPNRWLRIGFAAQKKETIFNSLLTHINMETLREAFKTIDGSKALGTDGISKKNYEMNLEDKLVDWVVAKILSTVFDPLFIRNSFGFRPFHSADMAINATYKSLKDNRRPFVVEIDFANFFNTIPHRKLMKSLGKRISDRRFKGLVRQFVLNGIFDHSGTLNIPDVGTPQGSAMSPILANIYLHDVIDSWFIQNWGSYNNIIVRYADDGLFFFKKEEIALQFLSELKQKVSLFGLSLNDEKTKIVNFSKNDTNDFDFLGFTFYWGRKWKSKQRILKLKTKKKTLHRSIQAFTSWIKNVRNKIKTKDIWVIAKSKLVGHYNYFGYGLNINKLNHFYKQVIKSLFKWLNRRSQKRSFYWRSFLRKLTYNPLPKPPAMTKLKHFGGWAYAK